MPIVSIRHRTSYRYRRPVGFGEHRMMLRPLEAHDQRLLSFELEVSPQPALLREVHDATDAIMSLARFGRRATELTIVSRATVEHTPRSPLDLVAPDAFVGDDLYDSDERVALSHAMQRRPLDDGALEAWARRFLRPVGRTHAATWLGDVTNAIRSELDYEVRLKGEPQHPLATLQRGRGSCRDFAVLMIEAARSLGFAAKFATGYVYGPTSSRTRGHTHAWARIYLPGGGWTDYDPTNGLIGGDSLIRTAVGVDSSLTVPLHGSYRGRSSDFLAMDVEIGLAIEEARQPAEHLRVGARG
ncbi:MAG TPA: transglutaminase family protein [Caulobacteraceae bacterium]